jgi:hypothetical protein
MSTSICKSIALLALGLSLLAGCKQGEGDRCEVNSDCESGLTCEKVPGSSSDFACQGRDYSPGIDATVEADTSAPLSDGPPATTDTRDAAPSPDLQPDVTPDVLIIDTRGADSPG